MSLLDELNSRIQGPTLTQLSHQLGTDEATTASAISMALPMLVGGLAANAAQPDGARALDSALDRDHDGSLLDNIPAILGAATGTTAPTSRALNGAGILGHILGGRSAPVGQGIGRATGLSSGQVTQLLSMLAPLVMAYLARRKREGQLGPDGVSDVLTGERREIERRSPQAGGLLGKIFDRNQDGNVIDDLMRGAPNVLGGLFGGGR